MMEAMGYVAPELVEEAARAGQRRPGARALRIGLAAACLCVLLTVGVWAAETIFGVRLGQVESGEDYATYTLAAEVERFAMSRFSPELQADLADGALVHLWDDWQSVQEYVGIPLLYSELLDTAEEECVVNAPYAVDGSLSLDRERTDLEQVGRPEDLRVVFGRVVDNVAVGVYIHLYTEYASEEELAGGIPGVQWGPYGRYVIDGNGDRIPMGQVFYEKTFSTEDYQTAEGLQATILTARESNGSEEYIGYLLHEGVLYSVHALCLMDGDGPAPDFRAVTEEVLDSFR